MIIKTYLSTYCQIVFLDHLKVKRIVDLHIRIPLSLERTLIDVECVVMNQSVENC